MYVIWPAMLAFILSGGAFGPPDFSFCLDAKRNKKIKAWLLGGNNRSMPGPGGGGGVQRAIIYSFFGCVLYLDYYSIPSESHAAQPAGLNMVPVAQLSTPTDKFVYSVKNE
ncbi:MAG: hypothetical protein LBH61_02530 [Dysgonamonadaceae bacterium]|jgi:hypothetical protein|nr:hypothetical protein [Dysgonamonadaceae bacterium]